MADVVTKQYVWGLYLDECVQEKVLVDTNGFSADETLYPLQDLLYRTTALTDSSGVVREAYDTDAYGNTLIFRKSGTPPAEITFSDSDTQVDDPTCPFLFTGQRYDAESGLYYYKMRQYSPYLGQFLSKDPIVVYFSPNSRLHRPNDDSTSNRHIAIQWSAFEHLHRYCNEEPVTYVDPLGADPFWGVDLSPPLTYSSAPKSKPLFNPSRLNCLGYACGGGQSIYPAMDRSFDQTMNDLGYTCTVGIAANDCKSHCNCATWVMVYIYVPGDLNTSAYDYDRFPLYSAKNYWNAPWSTMFGILDFHAMRGLPNGGYDYQAQDIDVTDEEPTKPTIAPGGGEGAKRIRGRKPVAASGKP